MDILNLNAKHLTLKARILHHMVGYNILPKAGHRDDVSSLEVFVVDSMLVGRRFNLGYMLIRHMADSRDHKTAFLPYGMILTEIFKHFKVPMDDEVDFSRPIATDTYNKSTIRSMGYREVGGVWIPKARNEDEEEAEDEMNGMDQSLSLSQMFNSPLVGSLGRGLFCAQVVWRLYPLLLGSLARNWMISGLILRPPMMSCEVHLDTLMDALDIRGEVQQSRFDQMLEFLRCHFPPPSASF